MRWEQSYQFTYEMNMSCCDCASDDHVASDCPDDYLGPFHFHRPLRRHTPMTSHLDNCGDCDNDRANI